MSRWQQHIVALLASLLVATLAVLLINRSYWESGSFATGDDPIKDYPDTYLSAGVEHLIESFSVSIGVILAISYFGAYLCVRCLRHSEKWFHAGIFVIGGHAPVFGSILAVLLVLPYYLTVGVLMVLAAATKRKAELCVGAFLAVYGLATFFLFGIPYFDALLSVYGD